MLILDVDGVLTDGRLFFGSGGIEMKAFNVHDGYGLKKIQLEGISIAIVSGRTSDIVEKRARELNIRFLFKTSPRKTKSLRNYAKKRVSNLDTWPMSEMTYRT